MDDENFTKCVKFCDRFNTMYIWNQFKSLKKLCVDTQSLIKSDKYFYADIYHLSNIPLWSQIKTLEIKVCYGDDDKIHTLLYFVNDLAFFDLINLDSLIITMDGDIHEPTISELIQICFTKSCIKYFDVWILNDDLHSDLSKIDNSRFKSLKALSVKGIDKHNFDVILSDLKSIHLGYELRLNDDTKLNNLKEICFSEYNASDIKILKDKSKMLKLERIHINCDLNDIKEDIETLIKLPSIKYMGFGLLVDIQKLNDILSYLPNKKRQCLKIRIMHGTNVGKLDRVKKQKSLIKLINILNEKWSHFMIIVQLHYRKKLSNEFKKQLEKSYKVEAFSSYLVVSDIGDNFGGYKEKWIMNCCECSQDFVYYQS